MNTENDSAAKQEIPRIQKEEDWGTDVPKKEKEVVRLNDVPPHMKLHFAKHILVFLFILFIMVSATSLVFTESPQAEKIWSFTSVAINSIVGVLIGYYFTSNK